tara:strand:+ start:515 stop:889 length:375 start_codon:yes stop_codon:yes gene_type:complete
MKTFALILVAAAGLCVSLPLQAQTYGDVPTVRYEGRPVENIVKDGVPIPNYNGDGRVEVDPNERRVRNRPAIPAAPAIILLWQPWRFGLPYEGPRYVWGRVGWDAVLFDRATNQPVYIKYQWFR